MFTGLVQHMGIIAGISSYPTGMRLAVRCEDWNGPRAPGDSIAVNGCCLTLVADSDRSANLEFDVIHQTLRVTTLGSLQVGDHVNLEPAATPTTLLGGHIVQGHIDATGTITSVQREGGEVIVRVEPPEDAMEFIIERGSIAVDGVSLTIARCGESWFEVALIPTSLQQTTLGEARAGMPVNLEFDYLAKIVVAWLRRLKLSAL